MIGGRKFDRLVDRPFAVNRKLLRIFKSQLFEQGLVVIHTRCGVFVIYAHIAEHEILLAGNADGVRKAFVPPGVFKPVEVFERCQVKEIVFGGKRAAVIKTNGNSLEAVVACGGGISYFRKSIAAVTSGIMEVNFLDFDAEKIINRVVAALYRLVYRFGEIFAVGEVLIIHDLARCSGVLFKIIDFFGLGFLITHIRNGLRYRGRRRRILGLGFIAVITACRK